jgi:surfeit locus 1 family protein
LSGGRETPASPAALAAFALLALAAMIGLASLGLWQVHRLAWKRDLIHRIEERIHAPAIDAPDPSQWPHLNAANSEYLRVRATGRFLNDRESLVQAVTELGGGFWLITPLRTTLGYVVLVNRGFVPPTYRGNATGRIEGVTTVTGLVRMSEPGGAFLRHNDPAADRWFSRDIAAIAAQRGLADIAPYFIDAAAESSAPPGAPVGGLTVIRFPNNHLQYAITWFALAVMVGGGAVLVLRREWRLRQR